MAIYTERGGIPINWSACNQYRISGGPSDHKSVLTWVKFMDQIDPRVRNRGG